MKVAIVPELGPWSASTRYRAIQHVAGIEATGHEVQVFLPRDPHGRAPGRIGQAAYFGLHAVRYFRRWSKLHRELREFDAVLVQRGVYPMGPAAVARPLRHFAGRVVLDLDDDVFEVKPALANRGPATRWLYGSAQTALVLERADAVVVSTDELQRSVRLRGREATVLPTILDPRQYAKADHSHVERRIVWAGTVGGLPYLDVVRATLGDLQAAGIGRLTVISSQPWEGPADFHKWEQRNEFTSFSQFAVGIMPLPDTQYTRAKAGFKLLQYMAAGLPVVASPVGVNVELIRESGAGFLAGTQAEWVSALRTLLVYEDIRREMSARALDYVTKYCDLSHQAEIYGRHLAG